MSEGPAEDTTPQMPALPFPRQIGPHCPRCDRVLTVTCVGCGSSQDLSLACPEPHCDYVWSPSQRELARMAQLEHGGKTGDPVTRAAG